MKKLDSLLHHDSTQRGVPPDDTAIRLLNVLRVLFYPLQLKMWPAATRSGTQSFTRFGFAIGVIASGAINPKGGRKSN